RNRSGRPCASQPNRAERPRSRRYCPADISQNRGSTSAFCSVVQTPRPSILAVNLPWRLTAELSQNSKAHLLTGTPQPPMHVLSETTSPTRPCMNRTTLSLTLLLIFLIAPSPVRAWNSFGHMEVAYLAYQKLTPAAKARAWSLLQLNPDFATWESTIPAGTSPADKQMMIFMIASIWADQIKSVPPYKDRFSDEDPNNVNTPDGPTSGQNIGYTDLFRHRYWHFIDRPFSCDGTPLPPV